MWNPNPAHLVKLRGGCLQATRTVLCMQLRQALVQPAQLAAQLAQRCLLLLLLLLLLLRGR